VSQYRVYVTPTAWDEIRQLPKKTRNRVQTFVSSLADQPRPEKTKQLDIPDLPIEVRRWRWDRWRIIYTITDADETVDVLAVRKRPPYDYGDLEQLLQDLPT